MKRIGFALGAALLPLVLTAACVTNVGSFAMISNKNLDLSKKYEKTKDAIVGKDARYIIIVFPTGLLIGADGAVGAVTDAVETNGIDFVKNADIENTFWYIPFIFGMSQTTVTGEGWKTAP
jgi:hypothetical protein